VGLELVARAAYAGRGHRVSFWRTASGAEVDFVGETPRETVPLEVEWTERPRVTDARHLETFLDEFAPPGAPRPAGLPLPGAATAHRARARHPVARPVAPS
jgi:hypothetical protein